jgi:predicted nucleotidyltransferase
MPYYYLKDLLDYAIFLKAKSHKESDTEYLESIPGVVHSIITVSKEELKDCTKSLDW